nr:hypothetical protein [Tanacetum cinerariifolium]
MNLEKVDSLQEINTALVQLVCFIYWNIIVLSISHNHYDYDGIGENANHENFGLDNLQIGCNLLHDVHTLACHRSGFSFIAQGKGKCQKLYDFTLRFTVSEHIADCEKLTDVVMRIGP